MSRSRCALVQLLCDAGLAPARSKHLARELDRLRLSGLGSDDLADLLLRWSFERHKHFLNTAMDLIPVVPHRDVEGQLMLLRVQ